MIAVYLEPRADFSRAMFRVSTALARYAPKNVEIVGRPEDADLRILHVIDAPTQQEEIEQYARPYAMIQYCLRSTQVPQTDPWLPLWFGAKVVWSYYDLEQLIREDIGTYCPFNFYHAPLGCDGDIFKPRPIFQPPIYGMLTSGYVAESECIRECFKATANLRRDHFHLGPKIADAWDEHVTYALGIPDNVLARVYSGCEFVAGLRRQEGFELPAVEGLLCGARPVVFDAPHYRQWYDGLAKFIPETKDESALITSLVEAMSVPHPVTESERSQALARFDWERVASEFWSRIA